MKTASICFLSFVAFVVAAGGAPAATVANNSKSNNLRTSETCPDFDKSNKTASANSDTSKIHRCWVSEYSRTGYIGADNQKGRFRASEIDDGKTACPAGFDFDKSNKQCRRTQAVKDEMKSCPQGEGFDKSNRCRSNTAGGDTARGGGVTVKSAMHKHETALGGADTKSSRLPTGTNNHNK